MVSVNVEGFRLVKCLPCKSYVAYHMRDERFLSEHLS